MSIGLNMVFETECWDLNLLPGEAEKGFASEADYTKLIRTEVTENLNPKLVRKAGEELVWVCPLLVFTKVAGSFFFTDLLPDHYILSIAF